MAQYKLNILKIVAVLALLLPAAVQANGLAVIKPHSFHGDESAKPLVYERIIDSHGPHIRIVTARGNVDILRSKLAGFIDLPCSIPETILEKSDAAPLRTWVSSIRAFSTRYPLSSGLLDPYEETIAAHLACFDSGKIRFEGSWMARQELANVLAKRRSEEAVLRLGKIEKVVSNEAKEAQGWIWKNGVLVSPEEAEKGQSPAGRTVLSDTLWPLIGCDLQCASEVLKNLRALMANQNGAPKVRTQRVHGMIQNVFRAEVAFSREILANAMALTEASANDRRAAESMKPNAFGTVREDEAERYAANAQSIRDQAASQLARRRDELLRQLQDAERVVKDFATFGELRVALKLGEMTKTIASRNFLDGEFESSLSEDTLVVLRNQISSLN